MVLRLLHRYQETKSMVIRNICYLLNSFLHCTAYENIIFCWVMHEQSILDAITNRLDTDNCKVTKISLTADEINLRNRLAAESALPILSTEASQESTCILCLTP